MIISQSQFYDLIEIFRIGGYAPYTNYLFLGALSMPESFARAPIPDPSLVLQVITSIEGSLVLKRYPCSHASSSDILIVCNSFAGITNHELSHKCVFSVPKPPARLLHCWIQTYGFYTECVRKYGSSRVWTYFTDMFDFLTLSVVIDDKIFCVHGGESSVCHVGLSVFPAPAYDSPCSSRSFSVYSLY